MIDVWLGTAAVVSSAVAYVVVGARRRPRAPSEQPATFAQRRRELDAEARLQGLDAEAVAALEEELALDALDEAAAHGDRDQTRSIAKPPLPHLAACAFAVGALAVGLYALWGEPHAPVLKQASQLTRLGAQSDPAALERLERALVNRARRLPKDADSWFYLAHLHMRVRDYAAAAGAFATLREITGANEQIDVLWAQASYLADGGTMSATTQEIVERVLAANPNHPELLELLAMDALRQREFLAGARYLTRALGQPLTDSRRRILAETLALARARLDPERPLVEATINVEGQLKPWLMVFVRPLGGGMPLAALRLQARRTQTVVLDDAASMTDALALSSGSGGMVELVARLSDTGHATAAGPEAVSSPVDPAAQPHVELTLVSATREPPNHLP